MDKTTYLKLECPRCHSPVHAKVSKKIYKFLIYRCPICDSNVVYYENHVDILSDEFVSSLTRNENLSFFGEASFPMMVPSKAELGDEEITRDRIIDLRILLNTERSFEKFIEKI